MAGILRTALVFAVLAVCILLQPTNSARKKTYNTGRQTLTCYFCKSRYKGDFCYTISRMTPRRNYRLRGRDHDGTEHEMALPFCEVRVLKNFTVFRGEYTEKSKTKTGVGCKPWDGMPHTYCKYCYTPLCNVGPFDNPDGRLG